MSYRNTDEVYEHTVASALGEFVDTHLADSMTTLHLTRDSRLSLTTLYNVYQTVDMKPSGLWYGIGRSWLDFVAGDFTAAAHEYLYKFEINRERLLRIDDYPAFDTTWHTHRDTAYFMDWPTIAEKFAGIEIAPYLYQRRLEALWYYGWDCASGCIWDKDVITDITLFAKFDAEKSKFVKVA